jgi:small-conductance mechanosensitive channel
MDELFNFNILNFGGYTIKTSSILELIVFFIVIIISLKIIKKLIFRVRKFDTAKQHAIYSLIKYFVLVFASLFGLQILGFNLSVLIIGSSALLVGVGLGLQNLFSDFVSGIILLVDSTVKVNDVIEVNGLVCQVQIINLRTTTVLTRDDKYIILPNTDLTRNQIINWTHSNITSRFDVSVGVDYSSDVLLVMKILKEAVEIQHGVLKSPQPFVRFTDYGDSSLNFSVFFWADEVFRVENIKSEIRVRIYEQFKKNGVVIPFPQRVVHMSK